MMLTPKEWSAALYCTTVLACSGMGCVDIEPDGNPWTIGGERPRPPDDEPAEEFEFATCEPSTVERVPVAGECPELGRSLSIVIDGDGRPNVISSHGSTSHLAVRTNADDWQWNSAYASADVQLVTDGQDVYGVGEQVSAQPPPYNVGIEVFRVDGDIWPRVHSWRGAYWGEGGPQRRVRLDTRGDLVTTFWRLPDGGDPELVVATTSLDDPDPSETTVGSWSHSPSPHIPWIAGVEDGDAAVAFFNGRNISQGVRAYHFDSEEFEDVAEVSQYVGREHRNVASVVAADGTLHLLWLEDEDDTERRIHHSTRNPAGRWTDEVIYELMRPDPVVECGEAPNEGPDVECDVEYEELAIGDLLLLGGRPIAVFARRTVYASYDSDICDFPPCGAWNGRADRLGHESTLELVDLETDETVDLGATFSGRHYVRAAVGRDGTVHVITHEPAEDDGACSLVWVTTECSP